MRPSWENASMRMPKAWGVGLEVVRAWKREKHAVRWGLGELRRCCLVRKVASAWLVEVVRMWMMAFV